MGVWPEKEDVWTMMTLSPRHCDVCGTERRFILVQTSRITKPFWLLQVMTHRRRMVLCEVCRQSEELPRDHIENTSIPRTPWKERGAIVFLVGLLLMIALVMILKSFP